LKLKDKIKKFIFQGKKLKEIDKMRGHHGIKDGRILFRIAKSLKSNSVLVQIGSYAGESTCFIAEGIGFKNCEFYCIDTWYNDAMEHHARKGEDVFGEFLRNVEPYRDKILPMRGYSYEMINKFPKQKKIDFLFIDGNHSYEGVQRDIQDWIPLVKKNGIVCFHDYPEVLGVKRAVDEVISDGTIRFIKAKNCLCIAKRN